MIALEKQPEAMKALHEILLKSRELAHAHEGEKGELFNLLDGAEYLLAVMMEEGNSTEAFRNYLKLFLEEHHCPGAIPSLNALERHD